MPQSAPNHQPFTALWTWRRSTTSQHVLQIIHVAETTRVPIASPQSAPGTPGPGYPV